MSKPKTKVARRTAATSRAKSSQSKGSAGDKIKHYKIADAKARFSALVNHVRKPGARVIIQRRDKEAAVLLSYVEFEKLKRLYDTYRNDRLRRALQGEFHDLDDVIAGLDLAL